MIPEADTVYDVESNRMLCYIVSIVSSGGVCVVGMYEIVKPRNLGNPSRSYNLGSYMQSTASSNKGSWEVRCAHSTEEVR
jgi:hypothetical protein